jgi:hypothetical protein
MAPTFQMAVLGQPAVSFAVTGPVGQTQGYSLTVDDIPTQAAVDRTAAKLQAFYDQLEADERGVMDTLILQIMDMAEQLWGDA